MLCDELKRKYSDITGPYYGYNEVNEAIAELKDKCQMHNFFWEGCGFEKRGFKNTIAVSEAFDRLEAENAELKQKLEDVQANAYAESVDAGMRERSLKVALWLARGYIMTLLQRDFQRLAYQCNSDDYKNELVRKRNRFYDLYEKCIKKAEEYK